MLVLDNVRSAYNVGSLFRTAETAAVREARGTMKRHVACWLWLKDGRCEGGETAAVREARRPP